MSCCCPCLFKPRLTAKGPDQQQEEPGTMFERPLEVPHASASALAEAGIYMGDDTAGIYMGEDKPKSTTSNRSGGVKVQKPASKEKVVKDPDSLSPVDSPVVSDPISLSAVDIPMVPGAKTAPHATAEDSDVSSASLPSALSMKINETLLKPASPSTEMTAQQSSSVELNNTSGIMDSILSYQT